MSSSYYITYGGNRLTFPGVTGSVVWEYAPPTGYYETLLWSGDAYAQNASLNLSAHPSAFDSIRVEAYGADQIGNSQIPLTLQCPYRQLSANNQLFLKLPFFGSTASTGVTVGYYFGGILTGCAGSAWKLTKAWGNLWNSTAGLNSVSTRYDFTHVRKVWGVHHG